MVNLIADWTEEKIEALKAGRDLDVLIETKIMGRKCSYEKGPAVAWDGQNKPIMNAPYDWMIEDYDPAKDGPALASLGYDPRVVYRYSQYDGGISRVTERLKQADSIIQMNISWSAGEKVWAFTVTWTDKGNVAARAHAKDELLRIAVYKGALKAMLLG